MKIARLFALFAVGGLAVLLVVAYNKGIRYMPPVFEPEPLATEATLQKVSISGSGAYIQSIKKNSVHLRAYVPEPTVIVTGSGPFVVELANVHPDNKLSTSIEVNEKVRGLRRIVSGVANGNAVIKWSYPHTRFYTFTAIGDSGGGDELEWILARSHELGAEFLLHLGDINYVATDYDDAERVLNNAKIPTFAAIGNHDFFEAGKTVYQRFLQDIGPLNFTFVLGGIRFVNLDTAASVFPLNAGGRSTLLNALAPAGSDPGVRDHVVFTHKPLRDPRDLQEQTADGLVYEHAVSGYESTWLNQRLLELGFKTLIAGHVHITAAFDHNGLRTFVSGAGLAHADLMANKPVAQILVGDVLENKPVQYRWVSLNMPMSAHCNPRGLEVLLALDRIDEWKQANERCRPVADETK